LSSDEREIIVNKAFPILLIEDSPEDCEVTTRALNRVGLPGAVFHCADGDQALDFLYRRGSYDGQNHIPRPAVILLDLNLPGTDGLEVLATVNGDDSLKQIPVVILSSSADERVIEKCYRAGANSYVQKPRDLSTFIRLIRQLKEYWFEVVILPTGK
jgi:two-component system, response regulator